MLCHITLKYLINMSTNIYDTNKTGSIVGSGSMDVDKERRTSSANF